MLDTKYFRILQGLRRHLTNCIISLTDHPPPTDLSINPFYSRFFIYYKQAQTVC